MAKIYHLCIYHVGMYVCISMLIKVGQVRNIRIPKVGMQISTFLEINLPAFIASEYIYPLVK